MIRVCQRHKNFRFGKKKKRGKEIGSARFRFGSSRQKMRRYRVKNSVYLSLAATDAFQGSRDPRYKDAEARAAVLPAEPKQNQKNKNENAKNRNQKAEITAVPRSRFRFQFCATVVPALPKSQLFPACFEFISIFTAVDSMLVFCFVFFLGPACVKSIKHGSKEDAAV